MRKILSFILTLIFVGSLFGQSGKRPAATSAPNKGEETPQKELVDIKADLVYPHKISGDSSVLCLVGNFAAQHNGAVITADSAVRYGDDRIDCFGNVLINKNTTYAYADRAVYDGANNEVTLYSLIVKVIDEDVTLYTYGFTFNTLDNIGEYFDGGVAFNKDSSRLESIRGYYYADTKDVVGVEEVEIYTPDYEMKGDSVRYNMQSDYAQFFDKTNIWNSAGEYLYTDEGDYDKELSRFSFAKNGYVLTKEQEVWSDSLEYFRDREEAILRSNIQIDDTTNKTLVYSDFAHYWGTTEKIFLSKNPSVVNYDPEQADSLFMRADTIVLTTHSYDPVAYLKEQQSAVAEGVAPAAAPSTPPATAPSPASKGKEERRAKAAQRREELHSHDHDYAHEDEPEPSGGEEDPAITPNETIDSMAMNTVDSLVQDSTKLLTPKELKEIAKEEERKAKEEANKAKAVAKRKKANEASAARLEKRRAMIDAQKARAARLEAKRQDRIRKRMERKGKTYVPPVSTADSLDSLESNGDSLIVDSLSVDSLAIADSLALRDSLDSVAMAGLDTTYRVIVGYRNAKTYQGEQQTICDSMTMDSRDSTLHLYIAPYLWNGMNQISSEVMDIYTSGGELSKAVFSGGKPIMASKIDTTYYNQVAGKTITSYFENNELVRNNVDANVQTIYFSQDEVTKEVSTMVFVESGSATFYFANQDLEGITYRSDPSYIFYPVNKIPETQPMRLEGFEWKGELKPTRATFSDRVRRASLRTQKEALKRPQFPIRRDLIIDIENLTADKIWMDRDDAVARDAEEWLESLGYKSGQPRTEPLK